MPANIPTLEEMIKVGAHFGHKRQRSYPKAKKYIFCQRDGIYIINLEKTQELLKSALEFLTLSAKHGKTILFVGTKKQAKKIVEESAKKVGMPYVTERWLGGTLTNFATVRRSIKYLHELEDKKSSEEFKAFTKHERTKIEEEIKKLHKVFDGILKMEKLPDLMFVLDASKENNAVQEAIKKEIPVVAICDTNANPDIIDYPVIANDEAVKSIEMMVNLITEAVLEGKEGNK